MRCASITVTFHPDPEIIHTQLRTLPEGWLRLIVDNGTPDDEWKSVEAAIVGIPYVEVLRLGGNFGLAAAQNHGLRHLACKSSSTHVLLLDQDSEPQKGAIADLVDAYIGLEEAGCSVGAVGPELVDPVSGVHHKFHQIQGWRWIRVMPVDGSPIDCAAINGSGTFMALDVVMSLAGMDESLFIDLVDADLSFRLRAAGYRLYGVPGALFLHRMGDRTARIWVFGWRVWPVRSPRRQRYLFRNTVLLMHRPYVPKVWKAWAVAKLALTMTVFAVAGPQRMAQVVNMAKGIFDGSCGRSGAL